MINETYWNHQYKGFNILIEKLGEKYWAEITIHDCVVNRFYWFGGTEYDCLLHCQVYIDTEGYLNE